MQETMSNLETIKEVLNDKYLMSQNYLSETNKNSKGNKFEQKYTIVNETIKYNLYRFESNKEDLFPFFSNKSGLKKLCDYILFAEEGNILYVFLIELKLGIDNARPQLLASKEFVEYVVKSSNRTGKTLTNEIHYRLIRISDKKVSKGKRNPKEQSNIEYDEDNYCDYKYTDFRLKLLMHY
jgi:hypothetical protein